MELGEGAGQGPLPLPPQTEDGERQSRRYSDI